MTFLIRLCALVGLTALVACTDVPQSEPCPTPEACAVSELIAQGMRPDVGKDSGGGVVLRNVRAAGALVVFDIEVPIPAGGLEQVQKQSVHEVTSEGFVVGFCEGEDAEDVFQFGNAFQVRTVGSDGVVMGASTIRSCGG